MKNRLAVILGIIMAFVALGAIPAGYSMMVQPDGTGLGMNTGYLKDSPFKDFFVPGLFLFIVNGLLNVAGAIICFTKYKLAGKTGLLLGLLLTLWIVVQIYSTGLISFMQPLFFFIGLAEMLISYFIIKYNQRSAKITGYGYIEKRSVPSYRYPEKETKQ